MNPQANRHRQRLRQILADFTFEHQREAANKVQQQFDNGCKAVIVAAEMQSGKSGIALALACQQRDSLSDEAICDRHQLKDTLFLVTLADIALQEQAADDLSPCPNVVVSNLIHFKSALAVHFKVQPPRLIIIDECHYGSASDAVRYTQLFDYLETLPQQSKVVLISATPFSAMFAAGGDSILRESFHTSLVFHKTPAEYHGVRQMHRQQQIVQLIEEQRDFTQESIPRRLFINHFKQHPGPGWALIRVASNAAKAAKEALLAEGIHEDQIFIVGNKLNHVEDNELVTLAEFKRQYQNSALFDEKVIAITVASFRAGINFGIEMKQGLIASWDSTISNIAAVVQANIGRASGYHHNTTAKHFTNLDAISAYTELLNYLEQEDSTNNFAGIARLFEQVCDKYQIKGFDRGLKLSNAKQLQPLNPENVPEIKDFNQYWIADLSQPATGLEHADARIPAVFEVIQDYYQLQPGLAVRSQQDITNRPNWLNIIFVDGENFGDHSAGIQSDIYGYIRKIEQNESIAATNFGVSDSTEVIAYVVTSSNLSANRDAYKRKLDQDDVVEFATKIGLTDAGFIAVLFTTNPVKVDKGTMEQAPIYSRIVSKSVFKAQTGQ